MRYVSSGWADAAAWSGCQECGRDQRAGLKACLIEWRKKTNRTNVSEPDEEECASRRRGENVAAGALCGGKVTFKQRLGRGGEEHCRQRGPRGRKVLGPTGKNWTGSSRFV